MVILIEREKNEDKNQNSTKNLMNRSSCIVLTISTQEQKHKNSVYFSLNLC